MFLLILMLIISFSILRSATDLSVRRRMSMESNFTLPKISTRLQVAERNTHIEFELALHRHDNLRQCTSSRNPLDKRADLLVQRKFYNKKGSPRRVDFDRSSEKHSRFCFLFKSSILVQFAPIIRLLAISTTIFLQNIQYLQRK